MNKKITPPLASSIQAKASDTPASKECPQPSEQTLAFLRSFARNYRADMRLPESLQGIMLG